MSQTTTVEEVAGELAKWLTLQGVSLAKVVGKAGLEALEFVGHGLMQGLKPGDSHLPSYTIYFPTHLYSVRVLEGNVNKQGEYLATDKHLKFHHCDMTWCHCGVMARWQPRRGIHNYVPDFAAFLPFGKSIIGELVSCEGDGAGFVKVQGNLAFPPDMQERACRFWTGIMQDWMNRGLSMPPPSGPIPYTVATPSDNNPPNTLSIVKPSPSPYVPVDAYQPIVSRSPYAATNPVPPTNMTGKSVQVAREQPLSAARTSFIGKFQDLVGLPPTYAELAADELCASEASNNTEASWSLPDSLHSGYTQSNRVMVDVHSTTMAANAAPASPLRRGGERSTPVAGVLCGGRRGRAERVASTATSHRGAGSVPSGPMGLSSQCSSSGTSAAGADSQVARPQLSDMGTSPVAHWQDSEVQAMLGRLVEDIDEARAANERTSIERDEAIARNECLGDYLDQVRRQNAGGRLNESSSPNQRGSTLIDKSANSSMHVESLELAKEKELLQQQFARDSEQIRANAQDTLDNVLLSNDETNARYQEEIRRMKAQVEETNIQN
ncbi:MAG: hypothetical protein QGE95_14875, partial [Arenicellales bacterium]|nr:hypothetical protein [Arenicellales bacterium]